MPNPLWICEDRLGGIFVGCAHSIAPAMNMTMKNRISGSIQRPLLQERPDLANFGRFFALGDVHPQPLFRLAIGPHGDFLETCKGKANQILFRSDRPLRRDRSERR